MWDDFIRWLWIPGNTLSVLLNDEKILIFINYVSCFNILNNMNIYFYNFFKKSFKGWKPLWKCNQKSTIIIKWLSLVVLLKNDTSSKFIGVIGVVVTNTNISPVFVWFSNFMKFFRMLISSCRSADCWYSF